MKIDSIKKDLRKINHDMNILEIFTSFLSSHSIINNFVYFKQIHIELLNNIRKLEEEPSNQILINYINNDHFTLMHMIPELKDLVYKNFTINLYLFLDNLKENELEKIINKLNKISYLKFNLKNIIIDEINASQNLLKDVFMKFHHKIKYLDEQYIKHLSPLLIKGEIPYQVIGINEYKQIYSILNTTLKYLDNVDERILELKKVYILILAGECECLLKQ